MEGKIRPSLTKEELRFVSHILWHFSDYMGGDDRPDHGLGILKFYRDLSDEDKRTIYFLAGKLRRLSNKHAD